MIDKSVEAKAEGDGFLSTIMVKSQMSTGEEREEEYVSGTPCDQREVYRRGSDVQRQYLGS